MGRGGLWTRMGGRGRGCGGTCRDLRWIDGVMVMAPTGRLEIRAGGGHTRQ